MLLLQHNINQKQAAEVRAAVPIDLSAPDSPAPRGMRPTERCWGTETERVETEGGGETATGGHPPAANTRHRLLWTEAGQPQGDYCKSPLVFPSRWWAGQGAGAGHPPLAATDGYQVLECSRGVVRLHVPRILRLRTPDDAGPPSRRPAPRLRHLLRRRRLQPPHPLSPNSSHHFSPCQLI